MKKHIIFNLLNGLLLLSFSQSILAETTVYSIQIDGLACPYCAYGIEKKFNNLKDVKFIDIDLEKGLVIVEAENIKLKDDQLKQLFEDSGFTYKGKQERIK